MVPWQRSHSHLLNKMTKGKTNRTSQTKQSHNSFLSIERNRFLNSQLLSSCESKEVSMAHQPGPTRTFLQVEKPILQELPEQLSHRPSISPHQQELPCQSQRVPHRH